MNIETQLALIDRIQHHRESGRGTDTAPSTMVCPTSEYTSPDRLAAERSVLRSNPVVAGLSGLLPQPGSFATVHAGDRNVIVTRRGDGQLAAMLNTCRHRGAEVTSGCGRGKQLTCPYHGWVYDLDGSLVSIRRSEYFDDASIGGLVSVPVLERQGLIWVIGDAGAEMPAEPLEGAEAELAPFGLADYRLFESTEFTRPINWKLAIDTFCESYHISTLHRSSLSPYNYDDYSLFDAFGPHGRMVAARRSIVALDEQPRETWSLLPHATILWFLMPNTVLIYQQDHVQLYQSRPGTHAGEAHLSVALYVPAGTDHSEEHWRRNFDILVGVTDAEDFTLAAGQQRAFDAGAQAHVVFGQNEPALQQVHRSLDELLR